MKRSVLLSTVSFPAPNLSRQIHAEHARDREISLMNKLSDLSHLAAPRCLPRSSHRTREGLQVLDNQSQFHRDVSVMWLLPPIFVLSFSHFLSPFLRTLPVRCLYASRLIGGRLGNYVFLAIVAAWKRRARGQATARAVISSSAIVFFFFSPRRIAETTGSDVRELLPRLTRAIRKIGSSGNCSLREHRGPPFEREFH